MMELFSGHGLLDGTYPSSRNKTVVQGPSQNTLLANPLSELYVSASDTYFPPHLTV